MDARPSTKREHSDPIWSYWTFSMPIMNGLEAAPLLLQILPTVILVLFTNYATESMEAHARRAGVHAVVPKNQTGTHLMATIRALFAGEPPAPRGGPALAL